MIYYYNGVRGFNERRRPRELAECSEARHDVSIISSFRKKQKLLTSSYRTKTLFLYCIHILCL